MEKKAIINQKGGTGKTTTVVNLGHALARRGIKTLLIDVDSQGNVLNWFNVEYDNSIYELLMEGKKPKECIVNVRENLDVLPSDRRTAKAENHVNTEVSRETVLKRRLSSLEENDEYDIVLLDCPPGITLLNKNALVYADGIYLPVSTDYMALVGVGKVMDNVDEINEVFDDDLEIELVIPTFFDVRTSISKEVLDKLEDFFGDKVTEPIRINVRLKEAPSHSETIFEYASKSHGAEDYDKLAKIVEKKRSSKVI